MTDRSELTEEEREAVLGQLRAVLAADAARDGKTRNQARVSRFLKIPQQTIGKALTDRQVGIQIAREFAGQLDTTLAQLVREQKAAVEKEQATNPAFEKRAKAFAKRIAEQLEKEHAAKQKHEGK